MSPDSKPSLKSEKRLRPSIRIRLPVSSPAGALPSISLMMRSVAPSPSMSPVAALYVAAEERIGGHERHRVVDMAVAVHVGAAGHRHAEGAVAVGAVDALQRPRIGGDRGKVEDRDRLGEGPGGGHCRQESQREEAR